jgi:hypothetical protein
LINKSVKQVQLFEWKEKMLGQNFKEEHAGSSGFKWWRQEAQGSPYHKESHPD